MHVRLHKDSTTVA